MYSSARRRGSGRLNRGRIRSSSASRSAARPRSDPYSVTSLRAARHDSASQWAARPARVTPATPAERAGGGLRGASYPPAARRLLPARPLRHGRLRPDAISVGSSGGPRRGAHQASFYEVLEQVGQGVLEGPWPVREIPPRLAAVDDREGGQRVEGLSGRQQGATG